MKKLTILFILSVTAYYGRLEASGLPDAWSEADLASVFDSGARQLTTPEVMPPVAQQIPSVRPVTDLEAFCSGKEVCYLDAYFAASVTDKGMPGFIQNLYESFFDFAQPLNDKEKDNVTKGLAGLNETELGRATCQGLANGACTLESLAANKVVVQAKDMGGKWEAVTRIWAGKILIVINRNSKYDAKKPLEWGVTLGHEMSHAEEYKKFGRGLNDNYRADTELKAYLFTLAIHNEMKLRHPFKIKDPVMDFLIQVWDWKEGKGPYPKDFYVDGKKIIAEECIRYNIEPAKDGIAAMRNMVNNYFYRTEPLNWDLPASDLIHTELTRITLKRGIEYGKWRAAGPVLQPLPQPSQPGSAVPGGLWSHGNGSDGTGTGNGTSNGNIPYYPHFQPWQ